MKQRLLSRRDSQKTEIQENNVIPRYQSRQKNSSMTIDTQIIRGEAIIGTESAGPEAIANNSNISNEEIEMQQRRESIGQ